jgi:hypothetical protein
MKDFLSFTLRGAWGGILFTLALMVLVYGSLGAFLFLNYLFLLYSLPPGAIVGLVLWFVAARTTKPLQPIIRFAIGTGTAAAILLPIWGYQAVTSVSRGYVSDLDIPSVLLRLAVYAAGVGGLAGLACPASRAYGHNPPELNYRERTRLYEAAEKEAQNARAGIRQADSSPKFQVACLHPERPQMR